MNYLKMPFLLLFFLVGCGTAIDDKGPKGPGAPDPTNNPTPTNNGTTSGNNTIGSLCGDGVLDAGELCDPGKLTGPGACPQSCEAGACASATLVGSASACTAQCIVTPAACANADGCCPEGCDATTDNDCANQCGDGVVDAGELCDGNCPSSCNEGVACTTDVLSGSATTCNAQCTTTPVTACLNGDGCCASGCTYQNDNDCACIPHTCAQVGAECGTIDNGCGQMITCADTCASIEACSAQNRCVEENFIGADCTDYPQCGSSMDAVCILPPGWPGGYCSIWCNSTTGNTQCPTGSHCADFDGANSLCLLNCTTDAQCDFGYVCRQWDASGLKECVPPEPPPGSGDIGDPCASDADCSGVLFCDQSYTTNNTTTVFPGGVCTQSCVPLLGECPVGNVCPLESMCMPACTSDADCRFGYSCTGFGLPLASTYCWPS